MASRVWLKLSDARERAARTLVSPSRAEVWLKEWLRSGELPSRAVEWTARTQPWETFWADLARVKIDWDDSSAKRLYVAPPGSGVTWLAAWAYGIEVDGSALDRLLGPPSEAPLLDAGRSLVDEFYSRPAGAKRAPLPPLSQEQVAELIDAIIDRDPGRRIDKARKDVAEWLGRTEPAVERTHQRFSQRHQGKKGRPKKYDK